LRCIQTANEILSQFQKDINTQERNAKDTSGRPKIKQDFLNIQNDKIIIDYRLSEFISNITNKDGQYYFNLPLKSEDVYYNSLKYLCDDEKAKKTNLLSKLDNSENENLIFNAYEDIEKYNERILNALQDIRKKYTGNILIITHADAINQFDPTIKLMEYKMVYKIEMPIEHVEPTAEISEEELKHKYLKYKKKYIEYKKFLLNSQQINN
jgi:hypothetical protein